MGTREAIPAIRQSLLHLHPCDQLFSNYLTPLTAGTPRIRVKEAKKDSSRSRIVKEEGFFMFPLTQEEEETPPPRIAPRTGAALLLITASIIVITLSPDFSALQTGNWRHVLSLRKTRRVFDRDGNGNQW